MFPKATRVALRLCLVIPLCCLAAPSLAALESASLSAKDDKSASFISLAPLYEAEAGREPELGPFFPLATYPLTEGTTARGSAPWPVGFITNNDKKIDSYYSSAGLFAIYSYSGAFPEAYLIRETLYGEDSVLLAINEYRYLDGQLRALERVDGGEPVALALVHRASNGRVSALALPWETREFGYDSHDRPRWFRSRSHEGTERAYEWQWDERGRLIWRYCFENGWLSAAWRYDYGDAVFEPGAAPVATRSYVVQGSYLLPLLNKEDAKQ